MKKIRFEKLQNELSRGNASEQYEALKQMKEFVVNEIAKEQAEFQNNANGLQALINEISTNISLRN